MFIAWLLPQRMALSFHQVFWCYSLLRDDAGKQKTSDLKKLMSQQSGQLRKSSLMKIK